MTPHPLYAVLGALVILGTSWDIIKSTLSIAGGGPLTWRMGRGLWGLLRGARYAGPAILLATSLSWILLLWVGWTLVFMGGPEAVVEATTQAPADFWARAYFAGYTLFTLGLGDFVPVAAGWRMLTSVATLFGLFFVTLTITYLLSVISAAAQKQQLALLIHSFGPSPEATVTTAWDGEQLAGLEAALVQVGVLMTLQERRHLAYPILHYYMSATPEASLAVQAARLDETLTLIRFGVDPPHRPAPLPLHLARAATAAYLHIVEENFLNPDDEAPDPPSLDVLRDARVPVVGEGDFHDALGDLHDRRRLLLGLVRDSGYAWSDAAPPQPAEDDAVG